MKNVLLREAIKLNREHKRKKVWKKVAGALSAAVVFCTTYALILPAITMEREPVCGLEVHEHTDACYEQRELYDLQCSLSVTDDTVVIHAHNDACYDAQGTLRCTLPEVVAHVHTDACYETRDVPCTLPEGDDHTHSEDCAVTESVQICALEEIQPHIHEENCYDSKGNLLCELPQAIVHDHAECLVATGETVRTLICQIPEHIHEDACYPLDEEDGDGVLEYRCGSGEHTHGENCVDDQGNLICTIPEHVHEAACVVTDLDLTADVETQDQWEATMEDVQMTGSWPADVLAIAETQLGYQESDRNVVLLDGELKGYTRYGQWYGDPYGDWCGMFAAFCLDYAGVEDFPLEADVDRWIEVLEEEKLYQSADTYSPKPGDLIFFDYDLRENDEMEADGDHVGLVAELIPATEDMPAQIRTIEGNSSDKVAYVTYDLDDAAIMGYGVLPERMYYCGIKAHSHDDGCMDESGNIICGMEEHTHSESCAELTGEYFESSLPLICTVSAHTHSEQCYVEGSEEPVCGLEAHTHVKECYDPAEATFLYEDESIAMTVNVVSYTGIPEGVSMSATLLDSDNQAYGSYADYAMASTDGQLVGLVGYQIKFYLAGQEIELPDAEITAEIVVKSVVKTEPAATVSNQSSSDGIDVTVTRAAETLLAAEDSSTEQDSSGQDEIMTVTVLQENEGSVTAQGTVTFENGETDNNTVTMVLGSGRSVALAARSLSNPEFTVEFYANIPIYQYSTSKPSSGVSLPVINTMLDGNGDGGSLPKNTGSTSTTGTTNGILYLHLQESGLTTTENPHGSSKLYSVATKKTLTKIYNDDTLTYSAGISLVNMDKLQDNGSYTLKEVRVSQDNGSSWTTYSSNLDSLTFTNNSAASDGSIVITEDTVIRLIYESVDGSYNNAANLFDYDITTKNYYTTKAASGTAYTTYDAARAKSTNVFMRTAQNGAGVGINSAWLTTSGKSARLAFGNANTGIPYQSQTITINGQSNTLNQYNKKGYLGCTFGLVKSYDYATDTLAYADGLAHQALFNDEAYYRASVEGKTSYYRNALNFTRTGDTYVLSGVNSAGAINGIQDNMLNYFFSPQSYSHIYTNNFWPMDGTVSDSTSGHDMLFGKLDEETRRYTNGSTDGFFPESDDGTYHNSYFGMQFAVEFALDGEYCGPLEYLFYGDDDMWVFLTDLNTGSSQMICDIGGVHSSVGSITNLWDYIPKNTAGNYVLSVFYTERGASGSSCYIEFTLPQVTSVTQNTPTTGSVSVNKQAVDESIVDATYNFKFELAATEDTNIGLSDRYEYTISGASGSSEGTIVSGDTFSLKADETITITGIPEGLQYTITEQFAADAEDAYRVTWLDADGNPVEGDSITDTVVRNKTHSFYCTNNAVGSLRLIKEVDGVVDAGTVFRFDVTLEDPNGEPLSGTYGGFEFNDGQATVEVGVGTENAVTITNLPVGTKWTVQEQEVDGFLVAYQVDGEPVENASGTIVHNQTASVTVVNSETYALPNTGGMGTPFFTFGGLLILAAALMYSCISGRKRRRGGR